MKVDRKIYKGIEYIQLQELPASQQEKLVLTANHDLFIKIMIDGKIVSECLQYKDYVNWFETVFAIKSELLKEPSRSIESLKIPGKLVFNKA